MLAYRCYPKDPNAKPGQPGHWSYLRRPQTGGRWDNAAFYDSWYLANTAIGAIAESFYSQTIWQPGTFLTPVGNRRSVAVFEVDDGSPFVDLDDPATLIRFSMIPSQVVRQNLSATQRAALHIFETTRTDRTPPVGVKWWSSQLPTEDVFMLWSEPKNALPMQFVEEFDLGVDLDVVKEAAERLRRQLVN